jgi:ribose transport system substrate-binding protein
MVMLAVVVAGCGSGSSSSGGAAAPAAAASSSGTTKVDVGSGSVEVTKKPLRIAVLMNGQTNAWQLAIAKSAQETASAAGAKATVLDAKYDLQQQLNQLQTLATSKKYDAVMVTPVDGHQECDAISKTVAKANVLVSVFAQPICGREKNSGDDLWAPGTVNFVGGDSGTEHTTAQLEAAAKLNPGPQNVAFFVGPELAPAVQVEVAAAKEFEKQHPDFHIKDIVNTDWTTPKGYSTALSYLHAHSDIGLIVSDYGPDLTRGILKALKASGKDGSIKVVDSGGSKEMTDLVRTGAVQATIPTFPKEYGKVTVEKLIAAQSGTTPARFVPDIPTQFGTVDDPVVITKDNVGDYTPEF